LYYNSPGGATFVISYD